MRDGSGLSGWLLLIAIVGVVMTVYAAAKWYEHRGAIWFWFYRRSDTWFGHAAYRIVLPFLNPGGLQMDESTEQMNAKLENRIEELREELEHDELYESEVSQKDEGPPSDSEGTPR